MTSSPCLQLDVNEDVDDAGATSRNSTQEPDSMELITIEMYV